MTADPGPVIGRGRASVIYDLGDGTVLRRSRPGGTPTAEVEGALMLLAESHGVPVPHVHEASGRDLRMELVAGPTMLAQLVERPQLAADLGRELGALHRLLDPVRDDTGQRALVHGDLHPGNVIMGVRGAVLVDWTNACWADRPLDVALSWLILACFEDPAAPPVLAVGGRPRQQLLDAFLAAAETAAVRAALPRAAEIRLRDPSTTTDEAARIHSLCAEVAR